MKTNKQTLLSKAKYLLQDIFFVNVALSTHMTNTSLHKDNYCSISNDEKTLINKTFFANFRKIANAFKLGIFACVIILFFNNCDANLDIIEESNLEQQTPPVLSEKISFKKSKHYNEINDQINTDQI